MLTALLVAAEESPPDANDVVAGWTGFAVFIGLVLAVAVLGWSLSKQLKKADRAEEQGLYDPSEKKPRHTIDPAPPSGADGTDETGSRGTGS